MTRKERLTRLAGGIGAVVGGCVIFAVSKAYDEANRAAILSIIAIFFGLTWLGQAIRGTREIVPHHLEQAGEGPGVPLHLAGAGLLGAWLIPGLGHWIIGRKQKAVLYFVVISATFFLGVLLAQGRNLSYERDKIYFLAYLWNAGETGLGWLLTRGLEYDKPIPHLQVGFLYTAVAGLLNLVAMIDFFNTCQRPVATVGTNSTTAGATDAADATETTASSRHEGAA